MAPDALYPLRFAPIFKSALWGGRRLADLLPGAPADGPIAEAWVLSDVADNVSRVADGPLRGVTLRELMRERRNELLGPDLAHHDTFPLLLKFIDARLPLSVQVHPDDATAQRLGDGPRGKTEAWVVVSAEPGSRIWAGLKPGVGRAEFEAALRAGTVEDCLHSFEPTSGDCVFLPAGTVHAIGGGLVVFEVQQTSDITYRLHDWGRVDARTGRPRETHVGPGLASTDFARGPVQPVLAPAEPADGIEDLVQSRYFHLSRRTHAQPFTVGSDRQFVTLVGINGAAVVQYRDGRFALRPGGMLLLPASAGECECVPDGRVTLLQCSV
jgi:mannose-6-phosphate isomerase